MKKEDLEKKVKAWLESQGYPLEFYVAQLFRQAGYQTIQSEYYEDTEINEQREIDVVAHMDSSSNTEKYIVRIEFVIECKSSLDKPWILFTGGSSIASPAQVSQRAASDLGEDLLMELCQSKKVQELDIFKLDRRPAFSMTQAFTTGKDITYSAASAVSKATWSIIKETDRHSDFTIPIYLIAFPIIVIEGKLLEASLNADNVLTVKQIESGTMLWRKQFVANPHTIIKIIEKKSLINYITNIKKSCEVFFEHANNVIEKYKRHDT